MDSLALYMRTLLIHYVMILMSASFSVLVVRIWKKNIASRISSINHSCTRKLDNALDLYVYNERKGKEIQFKFIGRWKE